MALFRIPRFGKRKTLASPKRKNARTKRLRGAGLSGRVPDRAARPFDPDRMRGVRIVVDRVDAPPLEAAPRDIRTTFYNRMREWVEDVALTAPESVLAEALASPSVRGGLVKLLNGTAADIDTSRVTELRDRALARGLAAKEALRELAGGFAPTAWVGEHLGISRQAVDKRRKAGKLLAIQAADGTFAYPLCQFSDEGVVPGLEEALGALQVENPWERLSALVNPSPALGGRPVLSVLAAPGSDEEKNRAFAVLREFLQ